MTTAFSAISGVAGSASAYFDYKTSELAEPNLVTPPLENYDPVVLNHAADELDKLGAACPRTSIDGNCSALVTLINDYKTLRNKIKAIKKDDE